MRQLIIIWILVLVTIIGGGLYMSNAINELIQEVPKDSVKINYCDTSGMVVLTANKCHISGFSSLEVRNSTSSDKQLITYAEDDTTEVQILQNTDYLQVSRHWAFLQDTNSIGGTQGSSPVVQAGAVR